MTVKTKLELEYNLNCSPRVLFNRLSTASGLSEWFAEDVRVKGKIYTFMWEGDNQVAEKKVQKENRMVRFEWIEDELDKEEGFFEFHIHQDDLTNDVSLTIIDFAEDDEVEETTDLWDSQIAKLKHMLGS